MSDSLSYLFRYRNLLTGDTLGAHRAIIEAHESCWWGWWQRPAEDARLDLWEGLQDEVAQAGAIIGLFNSEPGNGEVHLARVVAVVPPRPDGRAPSVPDGETDLIPEYYRATPFSSAWLRLDEIAADPVDLKNFYNKHSFRRAPRLAGISQAQRDKFLGKLVLDADELRSMDTTIWELRKARRDDRQERILTASTHVTEAVSAQPIPLQSNRVLHLSDLHFTVTGPTRTEHRWQLINEGPSTLHQRVCSALGPDPGIGLVVISGDISYLATHDEFYEAFRFIHALLGALKLGPDHLVIVPGNHDIAWTREGERWTPRKPVSEAPEQATANYRRFYERIFRHPAASHLGMARRFVCPNGVCLELGALNTSALEQGKHWLAGMGRVADGALADVASTLGWSDGPTAALRMLVLHHHLTATEDVQRPTEFERGFGMAADARKTLREAARHRVALALHGHRHRPFLGGEDVYGELEATAPRWALGHVGIVGAGSAGSTSVDKNDNYFNLLELHPNRIDLTMYRADSPEQTRGEFRVMANWSAPLEFETGSPRLGAWTPREHGEQ